MRGKLLFVVGIGVGYLASTEKGRRLTRDATARVKEFAQGPTARRATETVKEYAGDMVPVLKPFLKPKASTAESRPTPGTTGSTEAPEAFATEGNTP